MRPEIHAALSADARSALQHRIDLVGVGDEYCTTDHVETCSVVQVGNRAASARSTTFEDLVLRGALEEMCLMCRKALFEASGLFRVLVQVIEELEALRPIETMLRLQQAEQWGVNRIHEPHVLASLTPEVGDAAEVVAEIAQVAREHLTASRERTTAWLDSTTAREALEVRASARDLHELRRSATLVEQVLDHTDALGVPVALADIRTERVPIAARPMRSVLERHHATRTRKEGRVLAGWPDVNRPAVKLADRLTTNVLLNEAIGRYARGPVLVLPRSLEPLVRYPRDGDVSVAVLRASDSDAVIETAGRLVGDGTPAPEAVRLARAL